MSLSLTIDGDTRIINKLEKTKETLQRLEPSFTETGNLLIREFTDNFGEEGLRIGTRWKDLALSTQVQRARLGYGAAHPILQRTGNLMRGFRKEVQRFSVRVHNPVEYFRYHQLGGGRLPQRKMISFPERVKQEVVAVFAKLVRSALKD